MKFSLFFIALVLCSTYTVFAQEEAANAETAQNTTNNTTANVTDPELLLVAAPSVVTSFIFPKNPSKKVVIGSETEILIGFHNQGESTFNVTELFSALRYPSDWRYYIQNFTRQAHSVVIKPGEQHSFIYKFQPDPFLEARDLGFSGQFFYHDLEGNNYTSYFYNTTISLIESNEPIDLQTLFTYIGLIGVAGLVLFIIYKSVNQKKTKRAPRKIETGTVSNVVDADWLEGTNARPSPKLARSRSPSPQGKKVKST